MILTPFVETDYSLHAAQMRTDTAGAKYLGWYGAQEKLWQKITQHDQCRHEFNIQITPNHTIGFIDLDMTNPEPTFSIYIHAAHRQNGYGSAALQELQTWVIENTEHRKLMATVEKENTASIRTLLQCGFAPQQESTTEYGYMWVFKMMKRQNIC